jgi:hypothetical protein
MGATGPEHPTDSNGKTENHATRGTESGTLGDDSASNRQPADPDLADVVNAWPSLPEALKAGIVAMVKAAKGGA